jgi:hypothetical protein
LRAGARGSGVVVDRVGQVLRGPSLLRRNGREALVQRASNVGAARRCPPDRVSETLIEFDEGTGDVLQLLGRGDNQGLAPLGRGLLLEIKLQDNGADVNPKSNICG